MNTKQTQDSIDYWRKTAEHDYDTMCVLFKTKRYSDCLFFGHIILEKILKAHVVKTTGQQPPYIHNLTKLHEVAELNLNEKQLDFLDAVNDFNIRARYPEHKLKFYQQCTLKYTQPYFKKITELYHELCQKLKPKK
jgi:HEPN domain-containing protein